MRVLYAFWQVAELAAGYRYTTKFDVVERGGKRRMLSTQVLAGQVASDDSWRPRASLFP
jgi:hypothetical protein